MGQLNDFLKERFGVDAKEVVKRLEAKKAEFKKAKFDYDVTALAPYKSSSLPNITTDVIGNSEFLSMLSLEEGIKGTREVTLLNADVELQAKVACETSPSGAVIFTGKDLVVKPLYYGVELCNEILNGKLTEILNSIGMKGQNDHIPAEIEDILLAYLFKGLQRKAQRVVVSGDITSLNTELALFDGLIKIIENDPTVIVVTSAQTSITAANGYDLAYSVALAINAELLDSGMTPIIVTGRTEALNILKSWNDNNPYSQVEIPVLSGQNMRFTLPLTGVQVMTLPEYNGKNLIHAIPLELTKLGVDSMDDMVLDVKYDDYNDKLKVEASFRLGTTIIWGKYFVRLDLA